MILKIRFCTLWMAALGWTALAQAQTDQEAIARGTAAMNAAVPRAQADPNRPIFHVISPAQWMNDPNGPIFYKGYYHLFYQLNPMSDGDGPKYWGHVRSRDLAKWEPLPIALGPSFDRGEDGVWSGSAIINGLGQPMIFYTSVGPKKPPSTGAEQWAAIGDQDLIDWQKSPANPVLTGALHGDRKIYEWRDPFVFREQGRTFLVAGGNLNATKGGEAVVNIYEAQNPGLTDWKYRGVLFHLPDGAPSVECPNFFKLGGRWVLFVSPYGTPRYYVGDFNLDRCWFLARTNGTLDHGPNFYAPSTMQVPDGRRITWGWVTGFPGGRGWNGCLTLPRVLSLSRNGDLRQSPAPQLTKLRGRGVHWRGAWLGEEARMFPLPNTNALEISLDIDLRTAPSIDVEFTGAPAEQMVFGDSGFRMGEISAPITYPGGKRRLNARIFFDRSVLEVYVNNSLCVTRRIEPLGAWTGLAVKSPGGQAKARRIDAWPMKTIWKEL